MKNTFISILLFIAVQGVAQSVEETAKAKMKELAFMAGEWTGSGWTTGQDRKMSTFSQTESLQFDLGGTVLIIRGQGKDAQGNIAHNAFAVISYNAQTKAYQMHSWLENGMSTQAAVELLGPGKLNWWFKTESGTIRYKLEFEGKTWKESGEFSPDEKAWYPFLEMSLTRK
jgi:hypothetical protein